MIFFIIIKHDSQRIKKKNFKKLGKYKMWEHLIRELKGHKVFIDTDSPTIINKCNKSFPWIKAYKRQEKFILQENQKKSSPTLSMIKNFLKNYVKDDNEVIVTTHVTSPFLKLDTILKAIKKLNFFDSVHSVTKDYNFAWLEDKKKKFIPINFDPKVVTKTQNLNPLVQSNGAFFIFKKKTFLKYNNRIGKKPFFYEINFPESVEIDTIDDLNLAKKICKS
jgi:N-acylneuraminate cytidylyltransferase